MVFLKIVNRMKGIYIPLTVFDVKNYVYDTSTNAYVLPRIFLSTAKRNFTRRISRDFISTYVYYKGVPGVIAGICYDGFALPTFTRIRVLN